MGFIEKFGSNVAKIGGQVVSAVAKAVDRIANRQEFEAVIAAVVLVSAADGRAEATERDAGLKAALAHPALKAFDAEDVTKLFKENFELLGMDRTLGVEALFGKVNKISDLSARARIVQIAEQVAAADGDVGDEEKKMIERLRASSVS